jgi:hypothetical protein
VSARHWVEPQGRFSCSYIGTIELHEVEIQIEPLSRNGVWPSFGDTTEVLLETHVCLGISGTISKTHIQYFGVFIQKKDEYLAPLHPSH